MRIVANEAMLALALCCGSHSLLWHSSHTCCDSLIIVDPAQAQAVHPTPEKQAGRVQQAMGQSNQHTHLIPRFSNPHHAVPIAWSALSILQITNLVMRALSILFVPQNSYYPPE